MSPNFLRKEKGGCRKIFGASIIGAIVGFIGGLFAARKSGEELREDVKEAALGAKEKVEEGVEKAKEFVEETKEKTEELVEGVKEKFKPEPEEGEEEEK